MRIAFCIYDFTDSNLQLQPWLTIHRVADELAKRGHAVHIVTDASQPANINHSELHRVRSFRGSNAAEVHQLIGMINPDSLVFLPTPLNITTAYWLDGITCRCVGLASYSFYNARELFNAVLCIGISEVKSYLRHLLVPRMLWVRCFRSRMHAVVAQSASTASRLGTALGGGVQCVFIPPGIELDAWPSTVEPLSNASRDVRLLYLGAARAIRGFDLALEAMRKLGDTRVVLRVLARGSGDEEVAALEGVVEKMGLKGRVEIRGGWIERSELIGEIHAADAVLQPFVLVPSELPVTAMEVIACGTPVIGTEIDGLPSTIGSAGTVVRQCSASALADAIRRFSENTVLRTDWGQACTQQRASMRAWNAVAASWEEVLRG